jgi:hypothetical protein
LTELYWFRSETPWLAFAWLVTAVIWGVGGWIIAAHTFNLASRERLILGIGIGLGLYLWLVNVLGRWLTSFPAFFLPALLVFGLGCIYAYRSGRPLLDKTDLRAWPYGLVWLGLATLFQRLAMGMAVFDEPKNLSIVSTMAAGDIPPHHYMNAEAGFAYHYGFQLLGASLVRLGGLQPWSAFDLSRALVGAYLFILIAIFARRYIERPYAGWVLAGLMAIATGVRYLLRLVPQQLTVWIDVLVKVRAPDAVVGYPVSQAIHQTFLLQDGPPAPFDYGFMNGFGWPLIMNVHIGSSTYSFVLFLLIWLLAGRMRRPSAVVVLSFLLALWAMVWEASYGAFLVAGVVVTLFWLWKQKAELRGPVGWMAAALLISLPLAIWQGGTVTELARAALLGSGGTAAVSDEGFNQVAGFALRWPPAFFSKHFGSLAVFSPPELFVALLELGPVILFTPWITWWSWNRSRQGDWMFGIAVLSAWLAFLLPILFAFEYDRDISRFTEYALWIWLLMLGLMVLGLSPVRLSPLGIFAAIGLLLMVFGGLSIARTELSALSRFVYTEKNVTSLDARIARQTWDRLPEPGLIYDPQGWRATMLTGRLTRAITGNMSYNYTRSPEWQSLYTSPTIEAFLENGFDYVYLDPNWWSKLSEASRSEFSRACVRTEAAQVDPGNGDFRQLVSLIGCQP